MARTAKCRMVCKVPKNRMFLPESGTAEMVILMVEEAESLRLSDFEELDQDTASSRMGVSRGTYQRILYKARKKVSEAICLGKGIRIEGGNYEVMVDCPCEYDCKECRRNRHQSGCCGEKRGEYNYE